MRRFVEEQDRRQDFLLPASLDDYVVAVGFARATPAHTGRPACHPSTMLKIYLYGCLNRIQSSWSVKRSAMSS